MLKLIRHSFIILALLLSSSCFGQGNNASMDVFPNPLIDVTTLELHSIKNSPTEIIVFNIIGKEVFRSKIMGINRDHKIEVDLSSLNPGVYFLNLMSQKQTIATRKIVKKS